MPRDDDDDRPYRSRHDISYRRKGAFGTAFGASSGCLLGVGVVVVGIPLLVCAGCIGLGLLAPKRPAEPTTAGTKATGSKPADSAPTLAELADHPEKYKGKTLTFRATVRRMPAVKTLRDAAGQAAGFEVSDKGVWRTFSVTVPDQKDMPAVDLSDRVVVTFVFSGAFDADSTGVRVERAK